MLPRTAIIAILLAGCADGSGPAPGPTGPERCVALFEAYDFTAATMSTPWGRRDRMSIPPRLQLPVANLRAAGCITLSDELDLTVAASPVTDSGPAIAPVGLHAGVVTSAEDEAAVKAFFEAAGVRVRTVGAAGLGRRVYLGPFATQGAFEAARALALQAGFVAPYPASF